MVHSLFATLRILKNAIQAIGRAKDPAKAKAWTYKKLKVFLELEAE